MCGGSCRQCRHGQQVRMQRARRLMNSGVGLLLVFAVLKGMWPVSPPAFGSRSGKPARFQQNSFMTRDKTELDVSERVDAKFRCNISESEKMLVAALTSAGRRGQRGWAKVQHLYEHYDGLAVPVYSAALQAAYRCKQYSEAAEMYNNIRSNGAVRADRVILLYGLKIFGKLQDGRAVDSIWQEVLASGWVNQFLAGARIDAASEMGDIEGAASILEFMVNESVPARDIHFSSAINACKNSNHSNRHKAAKYFLAGMLTRGLQPNVVSFANLAGAHWEAPLDELQGILSSMTDSGVISNKVFIEAFLGALFQGRLTAAWTVDDVRIRLKGTSRDRLRVAKSVLRDARSRGVRLTQLSSLTEQYLQQHAI